MSFISNFTHQMTTGLHIHTHMYPQKNQPTVGTKQSIILKEKHNWEGAEERKDVDKAQQINLPHIPQ